jgi:hypothetical protein
MKGLSEDKFTLIASPHLMRRALQTVSRRCVTMASFSSSLKLMPEVKLRMSSNVNVMSCSLITSKPEKKEK